MLRNEQRLRNEENSAHAVAAKFLDTFMHQLMKWEQFRYLWRALYLPLDRRVCARLRALPDLAAARRIDEALGDRSPYALSYTQYCGVQDLIWQLVEDLNARGGAELRLTSRIELNVLWA